MTAPIPLHQAHDRATSGAKAANLARLLGLGFPVPAGVVVPAEAFTAHAALRAPDAMPEEMLSALHALVASIEPVAVRSSGIAEDLQGASFAGQYETVLHVSGRDALAAAVLHCWRSAHDPRVTLYQERRGEAAAPLAVLVQRMLHVQAAGVAFTANPVTGARDEVVISAVPAVGEALVSGERPAQEWIVKGDVATRMRAPCEAIFPAQALEVAAMARRIAEQFGGPQDVEWAFEDGVLHVLQARPITALPDPVEWTPPHPEIMYSRNFRLGEWLPEPVTPLFATLVLPALEASMAVEMDRWWGVRLKPPTHAVVNGWYFHAPLGRSSLLSMFRGFFVHPVELFGIMSGSVRHGIEPEEKRWREDRRPRYVSVVARGEAEVDRLEPSQLVALVAELAGLAGEIQWSLQTVGGFAWKIEGELAKFYGAHLRPTLGGSHQPLVRGLRAPTAPPAHMVVSLDPVTPTVGELGLPWSPPPPDQLVAMARERTELEARCKGALSGKRRGQFERILTIAQTYALVREEQIADLSLGWPLMRRALRRLGEHLVGAHVLARADDVYFLQRDEIELALAGRAPPVDVSARQRTRARQARLAPPLTIGTPMKMIAQVHGKAIEAMRSGSPTGNHLSGMPASPGRAKGPVRVVRGPAEFDRLQPGEVLVAPTTSPAWTPLFVRAVAIVTDGGSIAAHASLVAREYGLPAVVAAEGATAKLRDGMIVTVDGSAGVVELEGP